ncbi:hypothetical protein C8A05DRAFT_47223 [Staphylotrichum tortipilum]|uniref:Pre-mRNA-splicing factor CWC24 n=1 Tax=Staphylotrichum tortipilum TaxID=2831512 RepID=A0AAN6MCL0_9PEZI|nr:hypothetical protein C8A05DRAFT_47223 [Staphylotrichum longicolle]
MADTETAPGDAPAVPIAPVAVFKKRGAKGKANLRKRAATPPPAASDSDASDVSSSEDEAGHRIKRRKRNTGAVVVSSKTAGNGSGNNAKNLSATVFSADRTLALDSGQREATKQSNWYDEEDTTAPSARSLLGSTRAMPTQQQQPPSDGTYRGLANATRFTAAPNPNGPARNVGPIKAPPTNIRTITITDMAPDVCKDYKQTGFCGFGDGCKFLHAREDYAHGWQLDKEWENVTKGKKVIAGTVVGSAEGKIASRLGQKQPTEEADDDEDEALLESIPFVCILCRGPYKSPVVTRCGHYFCEGCALKRYRRDPSCGACGAGTGGVFNAAKRLEKLLARKREREERRRREARERGEEVSGGEEGEDEEGEGE